jgi:serine/threonine-protein kinase
MGIVLYELLTGQLPFYGEELQETFAQILEQPVPPIRSYAQGIPEGLEEVILRCLSKNREQRYENVHELAKALVPFGSGAWGHLEGRIGQILARTPDENIGPAYTPASGASLVAAARSSQNHALPRRETDTVTASTVIGRQSFITKEKGSNVFAYVLLGMAVVMLFAAVGVGLKARRVGVADQPRELPPESATALPPPVAPTVVQIPPALPAATLVMPQPVPVQPSPPQVMLTAAPTAPAPVPLMQPQAPNPVAQPKPRPGPIPQPPPPSVAPAPKASGKLPSQLLGRGD